MANRAEPNLTIATTFSTSMQRVDALDSRIADTIQPTTRNRVTLKHNNFLSGSSYDLGSVDVGSCNHIKVST